MTHLVEFSELQINKWKNRNGNNSRSHYYDDSIDAMFLYIDKIEDRIVAHRINDFVSFLYSYSDKEIIGVRIDSFFSKFIQEYTPTHKKWNLSETGMFIDTSCDFTIQLHVSENEVAVEAAIISTIAIPHEEKASFAFESIKLNPAYNN